MPFINDVLTFKSLSIVGLEKNTGKTETLNYILGRLKNMDTRIALTSIGIDGESTDIVTNTKKPEIRIYPGMIYISAEQHYLQKRIISEILDVSKIHTALGRLVIAKAINSDKVLLSGPADTQNLKALISDMEKFNVDLTIVDGALSRLSLASPAITEGMILTTGAAYSANIPVLVRKTKYVYDLINLPEVEPELKQKLDCVESGIIAIDTDNNLHDLNIKSVFMLKEAKDRAFSFGTRLFVAGATSNYLFEFLRMQKNVDTIELVVKDFSRIFATPEVYYSFIKKGGKVKVVNQTKLAAVCINPISPQGYNLSSDELKESMQEALQIPVYDVKKI
ncbi:MAG: hypothetical protein PHU27_03185 [Salinivirgaceae bacterium]|nr:hypothetical protein [Salinivirgaceae bacterium]MDD4746273.1 hypothetical protein [Salinivirgaceae bacterium]MDY0280087.1 hypothetical protein [Salinivirgaceae bacterium]